MTRGDYLRGNKSAQEAIVYTKKIIKKENLEFLRSLDNKPYIDREIKTALVHGSFLSENYETAYIDLMYDGMTAIQDLAQLNIRLGIFGHTHEPTYANGKMDSTTKDFFSRVKDFSFFRYQTPYFFTINLDFESDYITLFNPGSVGQSRNRIPNAFYGIVRINNNKIILEYHNVKYDIQETQKRILIAGLSSDLANRLSEGR